MAKTKATDLAYAAGLIDGEAHVGISRSWHRKKDGTRRPSHQLCVQIRMVDEQVLRWMHARFGGSVIPVRVRSGERPNWKWLVSTRESLALLAQIQPYVRVKARQVGLALTFSALRGECNRKPSAELIAARDALRLAISAHNYSNVKAAA